MALHQRAQPAILLRLGRHDFHQVDVALVGGMDVHRGWAERRIGGLLEHDCLGGVGQSQPAHFARGMRSQQATYAGLRNQFLT